MKKKIIDCFCSSFKIISMNNDAKLNMFIPVYKH